MDKEKVLPLVEREIKSSNTSLSWRTQRILGWSEVIQETQRDADWERMRPLMVAIQWIRDLPDASDDDRPAGLQAAREIAESALAQLNVEVPNG